MHRLLVLLLVLLIPHGTSSTAGGGGGSSSSPCNRRCGTGAGGVVPYPFGFSAGCPIALSCDANTSKPLLLLPSGGHDGAMAYPVVSFNATASTMVVSFPSSCAGRSVGEARRALSGANYGVSSRTGLFLRGGCHGNGSNGNASSAASGGICSVPEYVMSGLLRTARCPDFNGTASLTCIGNTPPPPPNATGTAAAPGTTTGSEQFLHWEKATSSNCYDALTSMMLADTPEGTPSLELGVAELGWWANGTCAGAAAGAGAEPCVTNAACSDVQTPGGGQGHRCACKAGMAGDGFLAGDGCYRESPAKKGSKKSVPFIIVGGVVAGVAAAAAGVLLLCRARRRRSGGGGGSYSRRRRAAMRLLSEAASSSGVPVYSYHEVARATDSFSHANRLGTGAYGTVYVGRLPASSPTPVAIKRLRYRHGDGDDDESAVALLLNEIKLISSLSHPNLVRLLGCCLDRGEQILVYEFMPNGTLSHHLLGNGGGGGGGGALPWRARLGVAAETAAAIAYLHAMRPPIFHRDVKSSNILLGADLRAKLADFGLSRAARGLEDASRSHVSTAPQGTPGYVDPEYHQNFHLSDKSDVYSFGVVLLELITAMKVVDFDRPANEVNLASLALDRIGKGRVGEIVDPALVDGAGKDWVMESVRHVSELAFRCLAFHKDVRPCMSEVAAELRRIRDAAPDPGPETTKPMIDPTECLVVDVGFDATATKAQSPVSVQEVWVSDHSSPSTNGSMPCFT